MNVINKILEHKLVVALTVLGGLVYTLYEPITKLFFEGYFHPNVVLDLQTETTNIGKNRNLLIIHVIPNNKGNVPLIIKNKNVFTLEVRKIKDIESNKWIDYDKQELVSKIDLLRNIVSDVGDTYTLETNSLYDEVETIQLSDGIYYINAKLNYDDAYVNQASVIKLPNKKE